MSIQLWRSKNGFVYNGVDYEFLDVDNVTVTRNERKHKTRGANSKNKVGFVYKENSKMPDSVLFNVMNLSAEIMQILQIVHVKSAFLFKNYTKNSRTNV